MFVLVMQLRNMWSNSFGSVVFFLLKVWFDFFDIVWCYPLSKLQMKKRAAGSKSNKAQLQN